jgi:arylsulfatase A-like enzyme
MLAKKKIESFTQKEQDRRSFLKGTVAGYLSVYLGGCRSMVLKENSSKAKNHYPSNKQPNVLIIFPDQLGADECSIYGGKNIRTPNIGQLAHEGVTFTNATSASPLCLPARGMLMTGFYPTHTGLINNIVDPIPGQLSLGRVFKDAGYSTGYIGKFHLVSWRCNPPDHPEFIPPGERRLGFDHWEANNCHLKFMPGSYFFYRDEPIPIVSDKYETDTQVDQAISFMEKHRNSNKPFFLVVAPHPPHHPNVPDSTPCGYLDRIPEDLVYAPNIERDFLPNPGPGKRDWHLETRCYLAQTKNVDDNVGRLMCYLERANLAEDTIVIFTSDHGDMRGAHDCIGKQHPYREGYQIPFIIRWPGNIPAGLKTDVLMCHMDVMPTLCSLTGLSIPRGLDGVDLSQVVLGKDDDIDRDELLLAFYEPDYDFFKEWRAVLTKEYCYARWLKGTECLTSNLNDPYQTNNLVKDPKYNSVLKDMRKRLTRLLDKAHDEFLPGEEYKKWYDEKGRIIRTGLSPIQSVA